MRDHFENIFLNYEELNESYILSFNRLEMYTDEYDSLVNDIKSDNDNKYIKFIIEEIKKSIQWIKYLIKCANMMDDVPKIFIDTMTKEFDKYEKFDKICDEYDKK